MPQFRESIKNFMAGNHLNVRRTVTSLPVGDTIQEAWMTIKPTEGSPITDSLARKHITTSIVQTEGYVIDAGETDGIGEIIFYLQPTDTDNLWNPDKKFKGYPYDIVIKTVAGRVYTPSKGLIIGERPITDDLT